jgi:predicted TIM-barrel fold metal-dependent hydrolase
MMYVSDWPYWDGDYLHSLFEIQQRRDLTEEQRHGVLYRAAKRFTGLAKLGRRERLLALTRMA